MAEPSKERIAAALALAEATCALATAVDGQGSVPPELLQARQDAMRAYRATVAKLRARAEVDAEIAQHIRRWEDAGCGLCIGEERRAFLERLCREETAPEPNAVTDHDADTLEPEPGWGPFVHNKPAERR